MSDTPRTDYEAEHDGLIPAVVKSDFARGLERELAAMKARVGELEGGCHMAIGYIAGSTSEPEKSGTYRYLQSVTKNGQLKD